MDANKRVTNKENMNTIYQTFKFTKKIFLKATNYLFAILIAAQSAWAQNTTTNKFESFGEKYTAGCTDGQTTIVQGRDGLLQLAETGAYAFDGGFTDKATTTTPNNSQFEGHGYAFGVNIDYEIYVSGNYADIKMILTDSKTKALIAKVSSHTTIGANVGSTDFEMYDLGNVEYLGKDFPEKCTPLIGDEKDYDKCLRESGYKAGDIIYYGLSCNAIQLIKSYGKKTN